METNKHYWYFFYVVNKHKHYVVRFGKHFCLYSPWRKLARKFNYASEAIKYINDRGFPFVLGKFNKLKCRGKERVIYLCQM